MSDSSKKEPYKRKQARKRTTFAAKIHLFSTGTQYEGTGTDISTKGCAVETDAPINSGDQVELEFSLQMNSRKLQISAQVREVRKSNLSPSRRVIGFEFIEPSQTVINYLTAILVLYR